MLKILELFGGIGACSKALERLGIDYEIADYVEIDKYAVASYNAIHNTNFQPQDITQWNKDIEVDLIMHGSPCQDFSLVGLQKGGDEGSGTRSSLMYETLRIVEKLKPKYVIWENVKNIISKKHVHNFNKYIDRMEQLNYSSFYQVLNPKDYGIPQNRERIFTISIRNDLEQSFVFPPKQELELKLKDMLEDEVDEKYYLSDKMQNYVLATNEDGSDNKFANRVNDCKINKTPSYAITVRGAGGSQRGSLSNFIVGDGEEEIKVKDYKLKINNAIMQLLKDIKQNNLFPILDTRCDYLGVLKEKIMNNLRIRKLTPKECWRLMGFDDKDYEKASKVNSNSQLYKQAGNSIVVNVLEAILKNLLLDNKQDQKKGQTTIFDFI